MAVQHDTGNGAMVKILLGILTAVCLGISGWALATTISNGNEIARLTTERKYLEQAIEQLRQSNTDEHKQIMRELRDLGGRSR